MSLIEQLKKLHCDFKCDSHGRIIGLGLPENADHVFSRLPTIDTVETLSLGCTDVSDTGLQHIQKLPNLRGVYFFENDLSANCLRHLKILQRLRELDIVYSGKSVNEGARYVYEMRHLISLEIRQTPLDDSGVKGLGQLANLESLSLADTLITDAVSYELASLKKLELLELGSTRISDCTADVIGTLREIESLGINFTDVTEGCLKVLAQLPKLKYLYLGNLQFNGGVRELSNSFSITFLSMTKCNLSHSDVEVLCQCKHLEVLDLNECVAPSGSRRKLRNSIPEACSEFTSGSLRCE